MDYLLLLSLAGGVGVVFLVVFAKFALRWIVRLIVVGLILLFVVGGVAWWWTTRPTVRGETKSNATTKRAADRR